MTEKGRQKDTLSETVHKEPRVVLSNSRSPLSLRVAKWLLFLGITRRLYDTRWFWAWILGLPLAGVATHLLYRHKTRGWRRPWGGWRDVEAAHTSTCWSKKPQPFELSFQGRIEDGTATVTLMRA